jgi:glycosyltransferase involved in cell wall biosynthesis
MRKLKIGIMGTRGIPNRYGGFEQFATALSVGLTEKGHEVFVYNSSRHPYKAAAYQSVQLIHCKEPGNWMGAASQFIYDFHCIRDAKQRNFDILLHLGYTSDSVWWRSWPTQSIHIVNMDGLEWKRSKYNAFTRRFLKKAEAWAAMHADLLVADSPAIKEHIQKTYNRAATFIAYNANPFTHPDAASIRNFAVTPGAYDLLIARMEPENNIEMMLEAHVSSGSGLPLLVIGDTKNKYGKTLVSRFGQETILFAGAVYETELLNNLRHYCRLYFHGHSVGGTNPSLLEAMACGCAVAAHDNPFNRAVLEEDADYFSTAEELASLIKNFSPSPLHQKRKENNTEKISNRYNSATIIQAYETLMLEAAATVRP